MTDQLPDDFPALVAFLRRSTVAVHEAARPRLIEPSSDASLDGAAVGTGHNLLLPPGASAATTEQAAIKARVQRLVDAVERQRTDAFIVVNVHLNHLLAAGLEEIARSVSGAPCAAD